jgi:DNA-binding PadR family transcriptional regulator
MSRTDTAPPPQPGPEPEALLPLTPAVFHILLVVADGRTHGYAIMREVEAMTRGQVRLGPGTLYRSLQRMVVDGLIEELEMGVAAEAEAERRRYYQLTPFGRNVARAEARRLAALVDAARARKLLPGPRSR